MKLFKGLRIGSVPYLNAEPLVDNAPFAIQFAPPSQLARLLGEGKLDAALLPIFAAFQLNFPVVDRIAIGSNGPVFSVFLAHKTKFEEISKIYLDSASRTSAHLLQILLAEYKNFHPEYLPLDGATPADAAKLLIGDPAIDFRLRYADEYQFLDLGEEWKQQTSLPFIYAVWVVHPDYDKSLELAGELRRLKRQGLENVNNIINRYPNFPHGFRATYLRKHLCYEFGDLEKRGATHFQTLLHRHGFLDRKDAIHFI